jgi:excisionase family DNA binding protein
MPEDLSTETAPDPTTIGPLLTQGEVAAMMRVTVRTVQYWVAHGDLPALRYGRSTRIRQADLVHCGVVMPRRTTPAGADAGSTPAG